MKNSNESKQSPRWEPKNYFKYSLSSQDDETNAMFRSEIKDMFKGFNNSIRSLLVDNILKTTVYDQTAGSFQEGSDESLQLLKNSKTIYHRSQSICSAILYMIENKYFEDAFILHEEKNDDKNQKFDDRTKEAIMVNGKDTRDYLSTSWGSLKNIFTLQPLKSIRAYFGEYVAFYFSFAGVLVSSLWIPSLLGIFFL